jgi:hypothetical protein
LPKLNFQVMRRTMATQAQGMGSVKDIQAHLRHAKADTTATRGLTYEEGLAFIERTRRQLDGFDDALPHGEGQTIAPEEAASIRQGLDELETDIRKDLGLI